MSESVPVRCPACRRERRYTVPSYPCACGSPVTPVLDPRTAPTAVAHRAWDDEWIVLGCRACGRRDQWPRPELGCACGMLLRIPVTDHAAEPDSETVGEPESETETVAESESGLVAEPESAAGPESCGAREPAGEAGDGRGSVPPPRRGAFRPVAIRTARDVVTAAALHLNRLGHGDIRRADQRPTSGIGLAARGLVAQVDPSVHPASARDVECLWLTAMTESAECVYFSLAGYTDDARESADRLGVPLFVLDLTGAPQPVNATAGALAAADAREGGDAHGGRGVRGRERRTPPRDS
ncbi:hypothetical protein OG802_28335 [Streptomyces sp. NBC_00704]|uniref:hypothetical protein n=1 Tax=Streptomyces sp. NBC_00704 TaxID=2975809 RepID=UPI002E329BC6|nr:hypothetical protein [Streptomyces sp. NBC_00704]